MQAEMQGSNMDDEGIFFFDLENSGGKAPAGKNKKLKIEFQEAEKNGDNIDTRDVQLFDIPQCVDILQSSNSPRESFMGYCLDSGAARSVVGMKQYQALCNDSKYQLNIRPSKTTFKFGKSSFESQGKFTTRQRVNYEQYLEFGIEIVAGDFPLLVGLEVMRNHRIILNYGRNILCDTTQSWELPIEYRRGH